MIGRSGLIKLQAALNCFCKIFVFSSKFHRFGRGGGGFRVSAGFSQGGRLRVPNRRSRRRKLRGASGKLDGFRPVAKLRVGAGREQPGQFLQRRDCLRFQAQDSAIILDGLGWAAHLGKRQREVEIRFKIIGLQPYRFGIFISSGTQLVLPQEGSARNLMDGGGRGPQFQCLRELLFGLRKSALQNQDTQVVMGFSKVRFGCDCGGIMFHGFVQFAPGLQRVAKPVLGVGIVRRDGQALR